MNATDPMQRPERPNDVLQDDTRSREQKQEYLENWRLDLLERVRATEENMAASTRKTDELSDQLRRVNTALAELRGSKST